MRSRIVVPQDTPAYGKGGSIDWNGFHCLAVAGQMIVATTPVTFCLMLNWTDSDGDKAAVEAATSKPSPRFYGAPASRCSSRRPRGGNAGTRQC